MSKVKHFIDWQKKNPPKKASRKKYRILKEEILKSIGEKEREGEILLTPDIISYDWRTILSFGEKRILRELEKEVW